MTQSALGRISGPTLPGIWDVDFLWVYVCLVWTETFLPILSLTCVCEGGGARGVRVGHTRGEGTEPVQGWGCEVTFLKTEALKLERELMRP